ncbi:hypothetical protein B9N43_15335 [Denitratisoma sp. DHT3]|uniref:response regulator n=1 Tax=Denitratisoma sp. DHT3 TaxID=1981880 RepID=UPI0011984CDC|nr:response regulator [Denitratisoma sp. DHT3]QDX82486.1 hypothetical protein B9N43_15335 [Denitratisoma sp. DHT3]
MKLQKASLSFSICLLLVLVANTFVLFETRSAHDKVIEAQNHRQQATALTHELQQETEQLASLVRAYTTTGEARYLFYYYDILAIRRGEKPAPAEFNPNSYWSLVIAGRIQHSLPKDGQKKSLRERMRLLGFSERELNTLNGVLAATAAMNEIEQIAFAATQGLYDPVKQDFVSDGRPHLRFASKLVNGNEYNRMKADLSKAVDDLSSMVDQRTRADIAAATGRLDQLISRSLALLIGTLAILIGAYMVIRRQVLQPVERLSKAAKRLADGEYATRTGPVRGVDELVALGNTMDIMAQSIENDIQAQIVTQRELESARRHAEEATRTKSMFLANMSHEIRTPMNAIIGMAYLALKTELTPRQLDYVENIYNAGNSLLGIVNDILDFSKTEAGKLELDQTRFRIEDVVANTFSLLAQRAQEKELELLLDIADPRLLGDNGTLIGDPLRLGQILTNLLSNSVKFTHQGHVMLSIDIDACDEDGETLRFAIQDTGIGMTEAQLGQLFQEFTQADGSTTRRYGGTGLGLSISKKLVELMGGEIRAESTPGEGATFVFTVRFSIAKPGLPPAPALPGVDALRVLVVDDQPENRRTLIRLLSALGVGVAQPPAGVESADSVAAALTMIRRAREAGRAYDLLLLDWLLPDLDGAALLAQLRQDGAKPPAVAALAYDSDAIRAAVARSGVGLFLSKPALPKALRKLVNGLTGNSADESRPAAAQDQVHNFAGMRVLLVEDNRVNQHLAIELMESCGIHVDVANDGKEALARLAGVAANYYHAVLMDLQMPVMDGYEATRRLRVDPRYATLPIIAMSAHVMAEEHERAAAAGMDGHINKPIEPDRLYATLRRFSAAANHREMQPAIETPATPAEPRLPTIPGLDTTVGMRRSAGMHDLYLQMLKAFVDDFSGFRHEMAQLTAERRWADVERLAHTLKGLAGTIGAGEVYALAATLETACRSGQAAAATALAPLLEKLEPLVAALQAHLAAACAPPPSVPSQETNAPGAIPACLPRLRKLLAEGDNDAIDLWQAHESEFQDILPQQTMFRIGTAMKHFELDVALTLLSEIPNEQPA